MLAVDRLSEASPPQLSTRLRVGLETLRGTRGATQRTATERAKVVTSLRLSGMDWVRLADHVAPFDPMEVGYVSTFTAAVREARSLTGRDLDSGVLDPAARPTALWAGSTVYLILLEQVGKSLRPKGGKRSAHEYELEKAIRQFAPSSATPRERKVLYALRCAWVHEFGLFNKNPKNVAYQHCFGLEDDLSASLVKWPGRRWDGDTMSAGATTSTTVGLPALGNLTEEVVRSVRVHSNATQLRAEMGTEELRKRFGFERTA